MKKFSILSAVSAGLLAGSLALAGPAAAHRGDAGDASRTPAGQSSTSTSAHSATEGQIGVGIFTEPAPAAGTEKPATEGQIGVGIFTDPATAEKPGSINAAPAYTSRVASGGELPWGPIGAAPAA